MSIYVPPEAIDAIVYSDTTVVTRRVDIYEADGSTLWMENAPFIDGTVSVNAASRDNRRSFDLVLENVDNDFVVDPQDGLWYDKIFKLYRGAEIRVDGEWEQWYAPLGVFTVDVLTTQNFPHTIKVAGKDLSRKLMSSKFGRATMFEEGQPLEEIVKTILLNGEIDNYVLPTTGVVTGRDFVFDPDTTRRKAIHDLAIAYNYEEFFDQNGFFVMREFQDPSTSPSSFSYEFGEQGVMIDFTKTANNSRIYNHIVVTGENSSGLPVVAEARNMNPDSPTSIERLGERTYRYNSTFIATTEQAQAVANRFLAVHSLEEYAVSITSCVIPWLEASEVVDFYDPNPFATQGHRFLLNDFNIPMGMGTMSSNCRRVELIG